jgi:hypothetical protein
MIAGAAAAQIVKEQMEDRAAEPKQLAAAPERRPARRGRLRTGLAVALRATADRLAPLDERWREPVTRPH